MEIREALPYVATAYGGIWVVMMIYMIFLGRRQARLEKEAELISLRLQQQESKQ